MLRDISIPFPLKFTLSLKVDSPDTVIPPVQVDVPVTLKFPPTLTLPVVPKVPLTSKSPAYILFKNLELPATIKLERYANFTHLPFIKGRCH